MKLESLKINNFKSFKDAEIENMNNLCVFTGLNGTGKTTILNLFTFVKECMRSDADKATQLLTGQSDISKLTSGSLEKRFTLTFLFKNQSNDKIFSYIISFGKGEFGETNVYTERLQDQTEQKKNNLIDFSDEKHLFEVDIESLNPDSPHVSRSFLLLGAFKLKKPNSIFHQIGSYIDGVQSFDIDVEKCRYYPSSDESTTLRPNGENLAGHLNYLHDKHTEIFTKLINKFKTYIPNISNIETKVTEDGRILLRFHEGAFEDPFQTSQISDGTIKMLAYLAILYNPAPPPLICIEEPETHLHPELLERLAEEFRLYSINKGQIFVTTHSPDFLNALEPEEVFLLTKDDGATTVRKASDDPQIVAYVKAGDKMGSLWREGLLDHPISP